VDVNPLQRELESGERIVREAGEIALRHWGKVRFEDKPDFSPVTAADRECEDFIARSLIEQFSEDGILGEEGASRESTNGRRWLIDPIDGTRDFIRGNPSWSVFLALEVEGQVAAGFAYFPGLGDLYFAARGHGAYRNREQIHVSRIDRQDQAVLCVNGFAGLRGRAFQQDLLEWISGFWAVRCFGGAMDAVMIARGQADFWLEASGKPWDFAPLKVIAEEAGAKCFDFTGQNTIYGGNLIICTPALAPLAKELLG
jgi:fructose-1,6-bisphosphatase/inositol monophosphatase family enzyme